jgi:hypothetical protein
MTPSPALRTLLSRRIRQRMPESWSRFTQLWLAFNAIYGGEPDLRERARVKACVRRLVSRARARAVLRASHVPISRILSIPPGDMGLDARDPAFRRATRREARIAANPSADAVERLASVAAVLYQVRCNLLHGSKDPDDGRDEMLVRESARVLENMLPELDRY